MVIPCGSGYNAWAIAFTMTAQTPKNADAWEYLKSCLNYEIQRIDTERAKQCEQ